MTQPSVYRPATINTEALATESLGSVSRDARLLYAALPLAGTDADPTLFFADPDWLAGLIFTGSADADVTTEMVAGWLDELAQAELIRLYCVDGEAWGVLLRAYRVGLCQRAA